MDSFNKAKLTAKKAVINAKQDIATGGIQALLTKRNIIVVIVIAVVFIGGAALIFGSGSGYNRRDFVGTWETNEPVFNYRLEISRNGTYVFSDRDTNAIIEQGRWKIEEWFLVPGEYNFVYYERYVPDAYIILRHPDDFRSQFSIDNDIFMVQPPGFGTRQVWRRR